MTMISQQNWKKYKCIYNLHILYSENIQREKYAHKTTCTRILNAASFVIMKNENDLRPCDLHLDKDVLDMTSKAQSIKFKK